MKVHKLILKIALISFSLNFLAQTVEARTLESFNGKIKNYASNDLPTNSIKMNIAWHQWKSGLLGFKKSIKSGKFDIKIDANGNFNVPSVNMGLGHHHKLTLTIETPQGEIQGWPESVRFSVYEDKDINRLQEDIKVISIYKLPAIPLLVNLTSHSDSKEWFLNQGFETLTKIHLKFEGARPSPYPTDDEIYFKNEFYPSLTDGNLPARYYFVNGDLGVDPKVQVDIELRHYALKKGLIAESHENTNFSLLNALNEFTIDDTIFKTLDRSIDGTYQTVVTINELATHTWDMFDSSLTLTCSPEGVLTGQLIGKPRGGNKNQVNLDLPISGVCNGFAAEASFSISLPSHKKTEILTGRILGVVHNGNGIKSLRGDHTSITGKDTVFTDLGFKGEFSEARFEIR